MAHPARVYVQQRQSYGLSRELPDGSMRCICGGLGSAQAAWRMAQDLGIPDAQTVVQDETTGDRLDCLGQLIPDPPWDEAGQGQAARDRRTRELLAQLEAHLLGAAPARVVA